MFVKFDFPPPLVHYYFIIEYNLIYIPKTGNVLLSIFRSFIVSTLWRIFNKIGIILISPTPRSESR